MVTVEEDFGLRRPKRLPAGTGHSGPGTRRGLRIEATDREQLLGQGHQRLVEGVRGGTATPGQYRRVQDYVVNFATREVVYTPPPANDVPPLMEERVGLPVALLVAR